MGRSPLGSEAPLKVIDCEAINGYLFKLTPLQTPAPSGDTAICVEKNKDSFSVAGYVVLDVIP